MTDSPLLTLSVKASALARKCDALLCTALRRCLASPSAGKAPTWIIQPVRTGAWGVAAGGAGSAAGAGTASVTDPVVMCDGRPAIAPGRVPGGGKGTAAALTGAGTVAGA